MSDPFVVESAANLDGPWLAVFWTDTSFSALRVMAEASANTFGAGLLWRVRNVETGAVLLSRIDGESIYEGRPWW